MDEQRLFREDQQFRQPWLWIMLVLISSPLLGTTLWMMSQQLIHGKVFSEVMTDGKLSVLGGILLLGNGLLLLFFAAAKLQVEVTTAGLFVRFKPLHRKVRKIELESVTAVIPVVYRPVAEYGGWGIRYVRHGKAYNIQGKLGVRIEYSNGCHLLIGTRYPNELAAAIAQLSGVPVETWLEPAAIQKATE
ncbi:MAG: hypothetical protein HYV27_03930 [Candidatus Hydrogenedentes bacterium]|nr:hypothetical protein [Candidatus Hydrogenedentota bacterium]